QRGDGFFDGMVNNVVGGIQGAIQRALGGVTQTSTSDSSDMLRVYQNASKYVRPSDVKRAYEEATGLDYGDTTDHLGVLVWLYETGQLPEKYAGRYKHIIDFYQQRNLGELEL